MATMSKPLAEPGPVLERYHVFHAGAHILSGHLEHPIKQPIEHYGNVVLEKTRREGLITESVGETSVEGLISFRAGHTRVSGSQLKNKKDIWGNDHSGWVTQSTSVLEGFNVGDVITADRVVAQVSAEHPLTYPGGHVPKVTFLGTHFENLQVNSIASPMPRVFLKLWKSSTMPRSPTSRTSRSVPKEARIVGGTATPSCNVHWSKASDRFRFPGSGRSGI